MQMDIKSASKGAKSGERAIIEDDSIAQQRRRRGRRWTMFRRRNYSRNCSRNSRNPLCPGSSPVNNSSTAIRDEPIKSFVIDQPICWLTKLRAMQFMPLPQDVFYYCWCLHVYPWNEIPCVQAARGRPWTTKVLLFATCSSRSFVKDALQTTMSRTPDNNVENKGIASVFSNLLETCEGLQQHLHLGDEGTILSVKLHILSYNIRIELFVYNAVT